MAFPMLKKFYNESKILRFIGKKNITEIKLMAKNELTCSNMEILLLCLVIGIYIFLNIFFSKLYTIFRLILVFSFANIMNLGVIIFVDVYFLEFLQGSFISLPNE